MTKPALSGAPPQEGHRQGHQQQANTASGTMPILQQPSATNSQSGQACPDTHQSKYDCNTIAAIANVRQADAAEWFNHAAVVEIGVGLVTAYVAYRAAQWAKRAADAGTNSYKAFVAAEDASIDVVFAKGVLAHQIVGGQKRSHFGFNVEVTNVGRSVAKLHSCGVVGQRRPFAIDQLLDVHSTETIAHRFIVEAREFTFELRYSSALHPDAVLTLTIQPYLLDGGTDKMAARIAKRALSERKPV